MLWYFWECLTVQGGWHAQDQDHTKEIFGDLWMLASYLQSMHFGHTQKIWPAACGGAIYGNLFACT